jgi:hypothetical protein
VVVRCPEHGDQLQPRARTPSAPRRGGPGCQQERSSLARWAAIMAAGATSRGSVADPQCSKPREVVRAGAPGSVAGVRGSHFC